MFEAMRIAQECFDLFKRGQHAGLMEEALEKAARTINSLRHNAITSERHDWVQEMCTYDLAGIANEISERLGKASNPGSGG